MHIENVKKQKLQQEAQMQLYIYKVACFVTQTAARVDGFPELCGISFICGSKVFE